jgi:hypothetical protein
VEWEWWNSGIVEGWNSGINPWSCNAGFREILHPLSAVHHPVSISCVDLLRPTGSIDG